MPEELEIISHEHGIYELIFHSETRQIVDEYFAWLETMVIPLAEGSETGQVRLIVNFSQIRDLPSFSYLTNQGRKLLERHSEIRGKLHIRGAFLARQDEMMVLSLVESFFKLLPIDAKLKAFQAHEREKAIAWLLE
jgi:hypothetical protein